MQALSWKAGFVSAVTVFALSSAAAAQQLTGTGTWQSLSSAIIKGGWTASLVRTGNHVEGTLALTGSNLLSGGAVSGDIDSSSIMLGVVSKDVRQATFSGQLVGNTVKGEWNCPAVNDHGIWSGTLSPPAAATQ
jgi:hypothetical protein